VSLLENGGRFEVVSWSSTARECLISVRENRADAVVADESLLAPGDAELLVGARLLGQFALITVGESTSEVEFAEPLEGVDARISGSEGGMQLCSAIRDAIEHQSAEKPSGYHRLGTVPEHRRGRPPRPAGVLSVRETEIAGLVAKGLSNRRIAEIAGLQEQTVKNMISSILRRLECENRTQVAIKLAGSREFRYSS